MSKIIILNQNQIFYLNNKSFYLKQFYIIWKFIMLKYNIHKPTFIHSEIND